MSLLPLLFIVSVLCVLYFTFQKSKQHAPKGIVLISGASSGIGFQTAQYLDSIGLTVFAGVRTQTDFEKLRAKLSERSCPIFLDVTSDASVSNCKEAIIQKMNETGELFAGVVNNAGIGGVCPVEIVPLEDVKKQFDVNVFGALRLIQAMMPLLSPVQVCLIEPGAYDTKLIPKQRAAAFAALNNLNAEHEASYSKRLGDFLNVFDDTASGLEPPLKVAQAVGEALLAVNPKPRYLVLPCMKIDDLQLYIPSGSFKDWMTVKGFHWIIQQVNKKRKV